MLGKIPGTYCPLCGEIGLEGITLDGQLWAYCPNGAKKGIKDSHTAYLYTGTSSPQGMAEKAPKEKKAEQPTTEKPTTTLPKEGKEDEE